VLDAVQAGLPQPANDGSPVGFNIDDYLIDTPSRTVLLAVKGDSMIGASIEEGDKVVVDRAMTRSTTILWLPWSMVNTRSSASTGIRAGLNFALKTLHTARSFSPKASN